MNYSHWSSLPTFLVVSFHIFLGGKPRKTLHLLHTFRMYRLSKARALSAKCLCLLSALAWNSKNIISYRGRMGTKTRPTRSRLIGSWTHMFCSGKAHSVLKNRRFWETTKRANIKGDTGIQKNPRRSGKCQVFEWLFNSCSSDWQMNRPNADNVVSMWSFLTYGSCIEFPW